MESSSDKSIRIIREGNKSAMRLLTTFTEAIMTVKLMCRFLDKT